MLLAEPRDAESEPRLNDLLLARGVALGPIAPIMLQPDLGTAVVIGFLILAC